MRRPLVKLASALSTHEFQTIGMFLLLCPPQSTLERTKNTSPQQHSHREPQSRLGGSQRPEQPSVYRDSVSGQPPRSEAMRTDLFGTNQMAGGEFVFENEWIFPDPHGPRTLAGCSCRSLGSSEGVHGALPTALPSRRVSRRLVAQPGWRLPDHLDPGGGRDQALGHLACRCWMSWRKSPPCLHW